MKALHRWAPLAAALVLSGCVSFAKAAPETRHYQLDYPSPAKAAQSLPVVLRIAPMRTAEPYSGLDILYRDDDHHVGTYPYHRWAAAPGSMVTALVVRDFASSQRYRAVEKSPSALQADYELRGDIEKIEEQNIGECQVSLEMRMLLRRLASDNPVPVLFQKRYEAREPCGDGGAANVVAAMSSALEGISSQLQGDVYQAIAAAEKAGAHR